ncbi:cytochrome P450 [Roridomyces roridus]|uniref:Cytochrome P450 n=1 Tax=Roridomyces roridus TaxID=1738132 RepID=A0AAD7B5J9_9AGAR|nr:cytochrome P450 [Roridomyces roridus]
MALTWLELTLSACGTVVAYTLFTRRRRNPPPPPGPRRLPLLGNLLDVPPEKSWIKFAEWGDVYGDICSISILGQEIMILNSASAASALLDKKSSIYSDRPFVVMAGELGGWKDALGLMPYGDRYRRLRRSAHSLFGSQKIMTSFHPLEEQEVHRFAKRLMEKPKDFAAHIDKAAGAIILRICHGYQVKEEGEDDFVTLASTAMAQFSQATSPGGFLVNSIPSLRHLPPWVPGTGFLELGKMFKETLHRMVEEPLQWVKEQIATGTAQPSILYHLLEGKLTEEQEFEAKWLVGSLYAGGAHTTVSTMSGFFKAMVLYPEVMAKAQKEIDSVIGDARLPKLSDKDDLPYLSALVTEVHRWHTAGPTGIPHCLTEDDVHNGWFIPKGTIVIANIWKMTHDSRVYTDPMVFNPERFIPREGKGPEMDPTNLVFGFGRRICPGRVLAEASVWLIVATTLAVFDISRDPDGGEIDMDQTPGTVSFPTPFECLIKPRSARAVELIQAEVQL